MNAVARQRRSWDWCTCFRVCDYQALYYEYERLAVLNPAWPLSEIRRLSVRERVHWIRFFETLVRRRTMTKE